MAYQEPHDESIYLPCKGQCNGKFKGTNKKEGYCSICYILNQTGESEEEYITRLKLPLKNAVKKLAVSDVGFKLFNEKLNNLYTWRTPLMAIYLYIYKKKIYLTAEQAGLLLGDKNLYNKWKLEHIICSRVIDTWNLTGRHGVGSCYYKDNNTKPKNNDLSALSYPSGKIFQPEDIFDTTNIELYEILNQ